MTVPRSKLFIAGDRLDGLGNAVGAGPDALSFDLEDGVAETGKASARQAVADTLRATRLAPQVWVRINGLGSGHMVADILSLVQPLRESHGPLCRESEFARCLLLQRRRGKWCRSSASPFAPAHFADLVRGRLQARRKFLGGKLTR